MPTSAPPIIEFNGDSPAIHGRICEGFVCEGFSHKGNVESTANVTHLKFDGQWYRMYFEPWMIFWRRSEEDPVAWEIPEMSSQCPIADVGGIAGVIGEVLSNYKILSTADGCRVEFTFQSGKRIVIEDAKESANYAVI